MQNVSTPVCLVSNSRRLGLLLRHGIKSLNCAGVVTNTAGYAYPSVAPRCFRVIGEHTARRSSKPCCQLFQASNISSFVLELIRPQDSIATPSPCPPDSWQGIIHHLPVQDLSPGRRLQMLLLLTQTQLLIRVPTSSPAPPLLRTFSSRKTLR